MPMITKLSMVVIYNEKFPLMKLYDVSIVWSFEVT